MFAELFLEENCLCESERVREIIIRFGSKRGIRVYVDGKLVGYFTPKAVARKIRFALGVETYDDVRGNVP